MFLFSNKINCRPSLKAHCDFKFATFTVICTYRVSQDGGLNFLALFFNLKTVKLLHQIGDKKIRHENIFLFNILCENKL